MRDALERAEGVADPYTRVRLYWSQARLATFERDPRAALENLRRAIALLEATEDTRQLGRAHLLCAEILTFERQAEQAGPHLELAEELLGANPDAEDLFWLRTEQARHAAQLGSAEEAISRAREALQLIGDSDPAERAPRIGRSEKRLRTSETWAARTRPCVWRSSFSAGNESGTKQLRRAERGEQC